MLLVTFRYNRLNPFGINTRGYGREKRTVNLYGKQTSDTIIVSVVCLPYILYSANKIYLLAH